MAKSLASHISSKGRSQSGAIKIGASEMSHRSGNFGKILNEPSVETDITEKTLNTFNGSGMRYAVPTGRVIATDSVIVATSRYVVPAAYDISPGRVKVPAAHNTPLFISAASTNSKWSTADSKGQPSTVNYTTTSSSVDVSGNVLENVLHSFVAESFDKEGQVLSNVSELGHFAREFTGKEGGSKTRLIHAKWSNHEVTDMRKVLLMSMGSDCWILWGLIDGIPAVDAGRWMFLLLLSDAMMLENGISTHGVTLRPGSDNQMEWMGEDGTVLRTSAGQSPYKLDISRDYQAFGVEMVKFTSKGLNQEFKLPDYSQSCCRVRGDKHLYCFNLANHPSGKGVSVLVGNRHPYLSPPMALMEGSCELQKHEQAGKRIVSSIYEPLQLLHMDLFGLTSIRSIDHKSYSLVVTDDFSRFSWVFFLGTKDETFYILRDFITFVENRLTKKVKAIRVLVTKPHNKTPYELLSGKVPNVSHFKPFGCHVTILNTSDHLGKFEGKADEGFLVGYSAHSKAIGYTRFKSNQPAGTQDTNNHAGTQDDSDSKSDEQLIVVPFFPSTHFSGPEVNHASDTHSLLVSINPAAGCSVVLIPPIFFYGVEPVHADDTPLPPGHSSGSSENSTRFPSLSDLTNHISSSLEMEGIHHHPTTGIFSESLYDADFGGSITNLAPHIDVDPTPTRRVHPISQIIGDISSPVLTRGSLKKSKFGESALAGYVHDINNRPTP
ncbi:putative ribonuclease H-like domain-containing protein [Tanacetum coccineum]